MGNITLFTKPLGNNVTFENIREASDLMYETRILGKLLKRLGENHEDIENSDLNDQRINTRKHSGPRTVHQ